MGNNRFLGKDVTISRSDGKFVRGICVSYNSTGIVVKIKNSNREIFVPLHQIVEIMTGEWR